MNDFMNALNGFKSIQEAIALKEKEVAQKEKEVIKTAQDLERSRSEAKDSNDSLRQKFSSYASAAKAKMGYQKLQEQLQEEDYNIEQLEEREKAIRQLESDIV